MTAGIRVRPASLAARRRRSPTTSWYPSPSRRTTTGWSTPLCVKDAARSCKALSLKSFLGCLGFGAIVSMGSSTAAAVTASWPAEPEGESRAPKPRPSPCWRLTMCDHLSGEIEIGRGAGRLEVVQHDGFPMARSLAKSYISRNYGGHYLISKVPVAFSADLASQAGPAIEHRQNHAFHNKGWVQPFMYQRDGPDDMGKPLHGVVLALERNQGRLSRRQGIEGQDAEGRGAIDDHVVITLIDDGQRLLQPPLSIVQTDQLNLGPHQVDVRGHQMEEWEHGGRYHVSDRSAL